MAHDEEQAVGSPPLGIGERLERLPMTWWAYKMLTLCSLAWLVEAFDIGLVGVILPTVRGLWELSAGQVSQLAVASTIGIIIGVVPSGILADRIGRKRVLIGGMAVIHGADARMRLRPEHRLAGCVAFPGGARDGRDVPVALLHDERAAFFAVAGQGHRDHGLAPVRGLLHLSPARRAHHPEHETSTSAGACCSCWVGCRLLYVFILARYLPESPRWYEVKGRYDDAERVMRAIESEVERQTGQPLPPVGEITPVTVSKRARARQHALAASVPQTHDHVLARAGLHVLHVLRDPGLHADGGRANGIHPHVGLCHHGDHRWSVDTRQVPRSVARRNVGA